MRYLTVDADHRSTGLRDAAGAPTEPAASDSFVRGMAIVAGAAVVVAVTATVVLWLAGTIVSQTRNDYVRERDANIRACAAGAPVGSDAWGICENRYGNGP